MLRFPAACIYGVTPASRALHNTLPFPEASEYRDGYLDLNHGSPRGAWVAPSVTHPTSAQVMISRSVSSSPTSGSVPTAQGLEPASDSVSPSLSLTLPHSCSVSVSKTNKR